MLTRRAAILGGFSVPLAPIRLGQRTLPWQTRLAFAARSQIGITRMYDPAYAHLSYPMGDVERSRGVCTDVIVRAYRDAFAMDLQQLVHEDMTNAFSKYPTIWGLTRPDRNIDHRRVPNLEKYIERHGLALSTPPDDTRRALLISGLCLTRPHGRDALWSFIIWVGERPRTTLSVSFSMSAASGWRLDRLLDPARNQQDGPDRK
jgi:hypothetical protein